MKYTEMIKWLAKQPAAFALGLLFWGEITILICSVAGGWLLSRLLVESVTPFRPTAVFIAVFIINMVVFYLMHFTFGHNSRLMEGLINIHRFGGTDRVERLWREHKRELKDSDDYKLDEIRDPFKPPERIRASAEQFKLRYFLILPTGLVLYLLSFASTIYRLFSRQVLAWEPGMLMLTALLIAALSSACFWSMQMWIPGYVSVRKLLGHKTPEGE